MEQQENQFDTPPITEEKKKNRKTFLNGMFWGFIIGGIFATLGVIFPSVVIITLLASVLTMIAGHEIVRHAFAGISVAVCALIVQAIFKLSKSGIKDLMTVIIAAVAFALSLLGLSPIIIILLAGVIGVTVKTLLIDKRKEGKK